MTIEFSEEAEADLAEAISFIAEHSPRAAHALRIRIATVLERLAASELDGTASVIAGIAIQSWPVPPYRIYYLRVNEGIFVVRLYHQARKPLVE